MNNLEARDIAVWVVMGLLAGMIADVFVWGSGSLLGYLVAGLVGSVVGGYLARQFNINLRLNSIFLEQMIISVVGAIIVLIVVRVIF